MNDITSYQSTQLPDTLEDLTQFVLVGKARLDAYMLKLRTINKLSVAQGIRDQTLKEAQEVSTALIAAEQRIGELLLAIPTARGKRTDLTSDERSTKVEVVKKMGFGSTEAKDYQQMAKNPEVVQRVMEDAIANGEVVTKTQVMREIAEEKRKAKEESERYEMKIRQMQQQLNDRPVIKKEVPPDDYEDLKKKARLARAYENDYKKEQQKVSDEKRRNLELQNKIEELKTQTAQATSSTKLIEGSIYFVAQCGSFVRDMGGYVWIADKISELPERERTDFIKAISAIHDWAEILQQNIERNM